MIVLGVDPSLTNFGWALHDTSFPVGDARRCPERGRFQTSPKKMDYIDRYKTQRWRLFDLIKRTQPDKVGLEFPVFGQMYSEGMYGLFLYTSEALKGAGCDVVFWTPMQIKAHARDTIDRPKGWKMDKMDMCEAAKMDAAGGRWNHNEADAYLCARLAARFWMLHTGEISEAQLSERELKYFTEVKTYIRGKKAGKTVKRGVIHREGDRFFLWSKPPEEIP